ncbi:Crp/Fnr family transcriptional regulator [Noviherbaspirillum sedimenti]|nr:Crp/Fnr family transcriptional regulator [Noviherbaspirillum sedimenti]
MPEDILTALVEMMHVRHLPDRARLHDKGAPPEGMYAVVRGCIRVSSSTRDGREALLALMEPGCWFGESSLLEGLPRAYQADAQGDSELLVMPRAQLNALLESRPELYRHFIPFLCQRIRLSTLLLEGNALLSLEERLASRLLLLAQNVLQGGTDEPRHTLGVSQENLSQMLGTSRQSINKVLKEWEQNGLIQRHYGSITLCDLSALERLSMPG